MLARLPVRFGIGVSLAACIVIAAAMADVASRSLASLDFIALYAAARLVALGRGGEVLDADAILSIERAVAPERTALLPFLHPPAVALLLSPLAALPFPLAYAAFVAVSVASVLGASILLRPMVPAGRAWLLLAFALLAPPSAIAIVQGQTTPLVLLGLAASLRTPPLVSGLLLGLAGLRPQTLPIVAVLALLERRRLLGFALVIGAIVAASATLVGVEGLVRYAQLLLSRGDLILDPDIRRVPGFFSFIGWSGLAALAGLPSAAFALALASLAAGTVAVARSRGYAARLAAASRWTLLATPHVLLHDGILTYPAVAERAGSQRSTIVWVGGGLAAALSQLAGLPAVNLWLVALALSARRSGDARGDT